MPAPRIAVLVGSLRKASINRRLANALERLAADRATFVHVEIGDLPLYNQDDDDAPSAQVVRLRDTVRGADAVLFVTPEYNRSVPGVLKNAIDHGSRPYGQSVWAGKPAGVLGASIGSIGSALAQQHLRNILAYLDMPTLGQPEVFLHAKDGVFDDDGGFGKASRDFMQGWLDAYLTWIAQHGGSTRD
ncbi:NAD(P)H-dependent oxidoreductase [Luteimonas sp. TWI662]|uniref:NADPH-dependent FMN reductase n=1 Tax=Luteimonas sp. TWI662 TaxID=3136789 RepID=UPI00320BA8A0